MRGRQLVFQGIHSFVTNNLFAHTRKTYFPLNIQPHNNVEHYAQQLRLLFSLADPYVIVVGCLWLYRFRAVHLFTQPHNPTRRKITWDRISEWIVWVLWERITAVSRPSSDSLWCCCNPFFSPSIKSFHKSPHYTIQKLHLNWLHVNYISPQIYHLKAIRHSARKTLPPRKYWSTKKISYIPVYHTN